MPTINPKHLPADVLAKLGVPAKRKAKAKKHNYPIVEMCKMMGLPVPIPEYRFDPSRRWKFDFAWPELGHLPDWEPMKLALEIDGGTWTKSRHHHGTGLIKDREKLNQAVILGWRVLRCGPEDVKSGAVYELIRKATGA